MDRHDLRADERMSAVAAAMGGHDHAHLVRRTIRTLTRRGAVVGTVREAALSAFHVATYPLGWLPSRAPTQAVTLPPEGPPSAVDPRHTPVIFVHGWVHNRSAFLLMARALRRAGFADLTSYSYASVGHSIEEAAVELAAVVDTVRERTGDARVVLVGHSMGGIVARCYTQRFGGYDTVDTVVTIGSPHRGTWTALVGAHSSTSARQLLPGSPLLRTLEETARPSRVRWLSFYSDLDLLVMPADNGKLVHPALRATNIRVRDIGHLSMLVSDHVVGTIIDLLTDPGDARARAESARLRAGTDRTARIAQGPGDPDD